MVPAVIVVVLVWQDGRMLHRSAIMGHDGSRQELNRIQLANNVNAQETDTATGRRYDDLMMTVITPAGLNSNPL